MFDGLLRLKPLVAYPAVKALGAIKLPLRAVTPEFTFAPEPEERPLRSETLGDQMFGDDTATLLVKGETTAETEVAAITCAVVA